MVRHALDFYDDCSQTVFMSRCPLAPGLGNDIVASFASRSCKARRASRDALPIDIGQAISQYGHCRNIKYAEEEKLGNISYHPTLSSEPKWSVIFGIAVPRMKLSFKTSQYERSHFIK